MKKLILITFIGIILSKPLFSQLPVCYDGTVYSWFYNLVPMVDNTQYNFTVPIAFQSTEIEDRLFIQPGLVEKHNLWNVDQRQKLYEKVFMDLALFSDYDAARKRAVQLYFLEQAPYLIKNSILYSFLKDFYEHDVDLSKSLQVIKEGYKPLVEIDKIYKALDLISKMTAPLTVVPTEISQFYPGVDPQLILNQSNFNAAKTWLEGFNILGTVLSATNAWINIDQASQNIFSTVMFSQVLANEEAKVRIQDIKAGLSADGLYNKDVAIQNAIKTVETFLEQGTSQQVMETLRNSFADNLLELGSGVIAIENILLAPTIISVLVNCVTTAGLVGAQLTNLGTMCMVGYGLFTAEIIQMYIIDVQVDDAELSICYSTIASSLCNRAISNCRLRSVSMYSYLKSTKYVIEVAKVSPLPWIPFYNPNSDIITIWQTANSDFTSKLDNEYAFNCVADPYLNVSPSNMDVASSPGTTIFYVASNIDWTASSDQSWCTVTTSDIVNGTITVTYQINTGIDERMATLTISGPGVENQILAVTQSGTSPCSSITPINGNGAAYQQTYIAGGSGVWNNNMCSFPTPGIEKIYQFTAPKTGIYNIQVTNTSGGYVDYGWKELSCSRDGWNCIKDIISPGTFGSLEWTAGNTYYILLDAESTASGAQTFLISAQCNSPSNLVGAPTSQTTASLSWGNVSGSTDYDLRYRPTTSSSWTTLTIADPSYSVTDLTCGTTYNWQVRTNCGDGNYSGWMTGVNFTTSACPVTPCSNPTVINGCGAGYEQTFSGTGPSEWNNILCSPTTITPGKEKVFQFTAPVSGNYSISVTSNGMWTYYVSYGWKEANCSETGWNCIETNSFESVFGSMAWTAGKTYYILLDANYVNNSAYSSSFYINCPTTTSPCSDMTVIDGIGPTYQQTFTSGGIGNWYNSLCYYSPGMEKIYQFTAPVTGKYSIEIPDVGSAGAGFGWSESSCSETGWNCLDFDFYSVGTYGLMDWTAGKTYYILVEGYTTSGTQNFYISLRPSSPCSDITMINGCGSDYQQSFIGGIPGVWNTNNMCNNLPSGIEKIYQFTAPYTGLYSIQVSSTNGGYVDYGWQESSCSETGWNCIQAINSSGQYGSMEWTAGTTYYILLDDENEDGEVTLNGLHSFYINWPCTYPIGLIGTPTGQTTASLSWGNVTGSTDFEVRYKPTTSSIWITQPVTNTHNDLIDLVCGTTYNWAVRTSCGNGYYSDWMPGIDFTTSNCQTSPCASVILINGTGSGYQQTYVGVGSGIWNDVMCNFSTPGIEKIYQFTAFETGTYSIQVTSASGGYVDYGWKTSSCDETGWNCVQNITSPGRYGSIEWTAGGTYYVLLDGEAVSTQTQSFYITRDYSISGYITTSNGAGISGVNLIGFPSSTITDNTGFYSTTVPLGWGNTVTPVLTNYTFLPINTNYNNVSTNQVTDYTGNEIVQGNCVISTLPWNESFDAITIPACWTQVDHQGNGQIWQFGTHEGLYHIPVLSGNYAYMNSWNYGSGNSQNVDLISPTFDFSSYSNITLQFNYYFESSGSGESGTLSYSVDNGATWTIISSFTSTSATNPETFRQIINAVAGQSKVKFKWNYTGTQGYSWSIDDIKLFESFSHDVTVTNIFAFSNIGNVTPKATVCNLGGSTETFQVTMTVDSYTSTVTVTSLSPNSTTLLSFNPWSATLGTHTAQVCTKLIGDLNSGNDCKSQSVKVLNLNKQVYGYNNGGSGTDPVGPTSFSLSNPGVLNSIADQSALEQLGGGTWAHGVWYATAGREFISVNSTTGTRTIISTIPQILALSYNTVNNTMYGLGFQDANLYSIDIVNGTATVIGNCGLVNPDGFAINNAGKAFTVDRDADVLGTIDLNTGSFSTIGPIGFDSHWYVDLEFDRESDELYMTGIAAYDGTKNPTFLAWIDQKTGAGIKIGAFEGNDWVAALAIPYCSATPPTGLTTQIFCAGSSPIVSNLNASGTSIKWYSTPTGGVALANSTALVNGTHYYATQTINGCESLTRLDVMAIINATPLTPTVGTQTQPSCSVPTGSVALSGLPAGTWTLVSIPAAINYPGTGTGWTVLGLLPGTYTFTVTNAAGCTSSPSGNVVINTQPIPPTIQASSIAFSSISNNNMTVSWTRGDGNSVLVVASSNGAVNADPVSGTPYSPSANFGSGDQIGAGNYVIYNGAGSSVNLTGLTAGTGYYYAIYEYNTSGFCYKTPALTGNNSTTNTCTPPETQASSIAFSSISSYYMTVSWTRGSGDLVMVVAREGSDVNSGPLNGTSAMAAANFGYGTQFGTGNYVVYFGNGSSVDLGGLKAGTDYHFAIYECSNNVDFCYKTPALTGNETTSNTSSYPYCLAGSADQNYEYISNVTMGNINQSSGRGNAGYENYTSNITTVQIGINTFATIDVTYPVATDQILIWIDWNRDNDFDEPGENVYSSSGSFVSPHTTANFAPPIGAAIGTTRMRIRLHDASFKSNSTPCGDAGYGEVEDYSINVIPGCSPPSAPAITLTQPNCSTSNGSITISSPMGTGISYSIDGLNYTNTTGVFTNVLPGIYTVTAINSAGCISSGSIVTITSQPVTPAAPIVSLIQPTCTEVNGTLTVISPTGIGMTYSVNGITFTNTTGVFIVPAGSLATVAVKSAEGCISPITPITIPDQPLPPASPTQTTDCSQGSGNATIMVTNPTGAGLQYSLDGGIYQSSVTFTGVLNGSHTIAVRNASGCITTGTIFSVSCGCANGPALALNSTSGSTCGITPITVSGNTFSNATSVTITANGAGSLDAISKNTSPFVFSYIPAAGDGGKTVIITVTTDNPLGSPCAAAVATYTLTVNAVPSSPTASIPTQPTCTTPTGSIILSGLPAGNWTINPGGVTGTGLSATISGLTAATYNFTVTNAAGCTSPSSGNVVIDAQLSSPATPTQTTDCSLGSGNATITVTNPTGAGLQYSLDGGVYQSSVTFTGVLNGSHTIAVRNASGCTTTGNIFSVSCGCANGPAIALNSISGSTCGTTPVTVSGNIFSNATSVTITANGAGSLDAISKNTSPFAFTYIPAAGDGVKTVIITVTTDNPLGSPCAAAVATYTLTVNAVPSSPTAGIPVQPTCTTSIGSVILSGLPAGNWTINPGGVTGTGLSTTISGLTAATYNFTVTNSVGCTSPASGNVVINAGPGAPAAPTVGMITQPNCDLATGRVVLGGLPAGKWTINPGAIAGTGSSITISLLSAGTNNYTVTNGAGCTSPASGNVTIVSNPGTPLAPTVVSITQPTCVIRTGSVKLNGLPAGNWTINPGGITGIGTSTTITGLTAETYNFTITNSTGCISAASADIIINEASDGFIPKITTKYNNDLLICYNLDNLFVSYQWYRDLKLIQENGTKQYYQTFRNPGTYYVMTTDTNGCINSSNSIDIAGKKSMSVYPNPASYSFALKLENFSDGRVVVEIFNSAGIKMKEIQVESINDNLLKQIPIIGLDKGIYVVKVTENNNESHHIKIVVIK